ncbi:MAG: hypothetical protein AAGA03_20560 [Planctomycetota bacterium]
MNHHLGLVLAALACLIGTGCSSIQIPVFMPPNNDRYQPVGGQVALDSDASLARYQKVREAKERGAIVLEVVGDETPFRVLPLPPEGRSVFVSTLLKQTGVQQKLGGIEATLYRNTSDSLSGVRMEVTMSETKDEVMPETDYALQPGDRLQVRESQFSPLKMLMDTAF